VTATTVQRLAAWAAGVTLGDVPLSVLDLCRAQRRSVLAAVAASTGDAASGRVLGGVGSWAVVLALLAVLVLLVLRFSRGLTADPGRRLNYSVSAGRSAAEWRAEAVDHERAGEWRLSEQAEAEVFAAAPVETQRAPLAPRFARPGFVESEWRPEPWVLSEHTGWMS